MGAGLSSMDKQIKDMKKTIVRVSLFQAEKNARAFIMGILVIDFIQRVFYHYPVTGLYILLINAILPFLAGIIIEDKVRETKEKELPVLQELYNYDRIAYYGQGVTVLLTTLMLWLWYKKTSVVKMMSWHMKFGPVLMLIAYLGVLIIMFCRYFKGFEEQLNSNKL